jgi:hypothetical protein
MTHDYQRLTARVFAQVPFRILVLGREVRFEKNEGANVEVNYGDVPSEAVFMKAVKGWQNRKGIWRSDFVPMYRAIRERFAERPVMTDFVTYLCNHRHCVKLLIVDPAKRFESYRVRRMAIDEICLTWLTVNFAERANGKVKFAMPCAGFLSTIPKWETAADQMHGRSLLRTMCNKNVSDLTGLCPAHQKPNARTLFNYYPFFEAEGFAELMG